MKEKRVVIIVLLLTAYLLTTITGTTASTSNLDFEIEFVGVWGRGQYYKGESITLGSFISNTGGKTFTVSSRFEILSPTNKIYHAVGEALDEFLDPGESTIIDGNWTIPTNAEIGWYRVKVIVTATANGEQLTKSKEDIGFKVIEPTGIDLVSEIYIDGVLVSPWPNVQYPYTWEGKQDAVIEYVIKNVGTSDAGPFWVRYWYAEAGTPPHPNNLNETVRYSGLAAGEVIRKIHQVSNLKIGTNKWARVVVDYKGEVDELNETNNDSTVFHKVVDALQAKLWISSHTISFGNMKPYMKSCLILDLKNVGSGVMVWGVNENLNWITVEPTRGNATTETDTILVTCSTESLAPGSYYGYISVVSNGGGMNIYVNVEVKAAGYAIIVAGTCPRLLEPDPILWLTNKTANKAYLTLLELGFTRDDIYYISPIPNQDVDGDGNSNNDVDATLTLDNFRVAIELAKTKVNAYVPLLIYLTDHGANDIFCFGQWPWEWLRAKDLSAYLNDVRLSTGCNNNHSNN
ncbi:MAG: CARDB domain-containing protein [Candidatus Bathyarchaeia archaeon]